MLFCSPKFESLEGDNVQQQLNVALKIQKHIHKCSMALEAWFRLIVTTHVNDCFVGWIISTSKYEQTRLLVIWSLLDENEHIKIADVKIFLAALVMKIELSRHVNTSTTTLCWWNLKLSVALACRRLLCRQSTWGLNALHLAESESLSIHKNWGFP